MTKSTVPSRFLCGVVTLLAACDSQPPVGDAATIADDSGTPGLDADCSRRDVEYEIGDARDDDGGRLSELEEYERLRAMQMPDASLQYRCRR